MPNSTTYDLVAIRAALLARLGEKANALPEQTLRLFPHVAARLTEVWGTPDGEHYLQDLLVCDRPDRHGFPDDVASELFRLSVIHSAVVEELAGGASGNAWGDPTEIQLRTNAEALQKIADERAAMRRQRDAMAIGTLPT
jgi:hypothetical protein